MANINYLMAAWHGARHFDKFCPKPKRSTYYLEEQLRYLGALKHSLRQITIIAPGLSNAPDEYAEFIAALPDRLGNAKLAVFPRENVGISYGGYVEAARHYQNDFSHFMLVEDDYVPVFNDFDTVFLNTLKRNARRQKKPAGYVCSHIAGQCPAHSVGLVTTEAMAKAHEGHAALIARRPHGYRIQAEFAKPFINNGYSFGHISDHCRTPFTDSRYWPSYRELSRSAGPVVFAPVQLASKFDGSNEEPA
jgi:hypothetical protein